MNWSLGVTNHKAAIKDTAEGVCADKATGWCLNWDIFTLENMQQQSSTKVHIETPLLALAGFISVTPLSEAQR